MSVLKDWSLSRARSAQDKLRADLACHELVETSAQHLAGLLFEEFGGAIVLARIFATLPEGELPAFNRKKVASLARSKGVEALVNPATPVLSLLGTRGVRSEWNERRLSEGHVGIPLVSAEFVNGIPMLANLLSQLGLDLRWLERKREAAPEQRMLGGEATETFLVEEAETAADSLGRKVIPAQEFVKAYRVRSVFGMGGSWPNGAYVLAVVFAREPAERQLVRRLAPLLTVFRSSTTALAMRGQFLRE